MKMFLLPMLVALVLSFGGNQFAEIWIGADIATGPVIKGFDKRIEYATCKD